MSVHLPRGAARRAAPDIMHSGVRPDRPLGSLTRTVPSKLSASRRAGPPEDDSRATRDREWLCCPSVRRKAPLDATTVVARGSLTWLQAHERASSRSLRAPPRAPRPSRRRERGRALVQAVSGPLRPRLTQRRHPAGTSFKRTKLFSCTPRCTFAPSLHKADITHVRHQDQRGRGDARRQPEHAALVGTALRLPRPERTRCHRQYDQPRSGSAHRL